MTHAASSVGAVVDKLMEAGNQNNSKNEKKPTVELLNVQEDIVPKSNIEKPNLELPKSHELENIRAWKIFTQLAIIVLLLILHFKLLLDYFRDRTPSDLQNASFLTKDQRKAVLLFESNKEVANAAALMINNDDIPSAPPASAASH